jgi:predicted nucleic acid-binding protein
VDDELRVIVLDASILIRAIFGRRVLSLLETHEKRVIFASPDICFEDAERYIPELTKKRRLDPAQGFAVLKHLEEFIYPIGVEGYGRFAAESQRRIGRDISDWPIVACCLLLDCPVWTEDQDFFGCGLTTWNTRNIELFLREF